ncbi:MAG: hypothetical protein CVT70_02865 [Alphaproteobacteria bacterium HGW-Alphaproteobacteria-1]|jgi:uncharacterized membrane protein|nr:MAG: hypothetical protein CVT70_02865 [Alphaproteobacteria bacterium HGW-Alphaproteobacteria-1]
MSVTWHRDFVRSFSGLGLLLGTVFLAASLTPSLVPRGAVVQGLLSGLSLSAGYGLGVVLRAGWRALQLPSPQGHARILLVLVAVAVSAVLAGVAIWKAAVWQNRLRALMEMPPIEAVHPVTVLGVTLAVFLLLVLLVRLVRGTWRRISTRLARRLPGPQAALIALATTALLFWLIGNGVLVKGAMRMFDATYAALDARFDEHSPRPVDPFKTGGPGSLITWESLGRAGRGFVAGEPDAARITAMTGGLSKEPLRVYVGLNSADTPAERAALALAELIRVGGFERGTLVIATPTGTGWIDPEGQTSLEYLMRGDVATVAVQYSYLASWLALLADPDYGVETARAVFAAIYEHWRALPSDTRPRLFLHGLSLGAFNSDLSHDLHQVIADPYHGAFWTGAPFPSRTWMTATRGRTADSPYWLPTFRDGSVIRFTAQKNHLDAATAPWGSYRVVFLQYASDAITFYDPRAIWRQPEWMRSPRGPDVSPDMIWLPVVTFLQLTLDLMTAVLPPKGFGHVYAFDHYLDAWAALTDASGWTREELDALKARVAADR